MGRRCDDIGVPMLVNLPQKGYGYEDTGEGGLAFFLVVQQKDFEHRRQTCIAGGIIWPRQNVQLRPKGVRETCIDAGLLIGSTGQSLWSDTKEQYFTARLSDLTPEGKRLYHALKRIYGEATIITLLDT